MGNLSGEKFIKCIEENAYTTEDIFSRYEVPNFLHYKLEISTFYMLVFYGLVKSLQINPINPEKKPVKRYWIKLNGHLRYNIYFTDPKVQFISDDASLIPRTKLVLKQNEGEMRIRLKVKVSSKSVLKKFVTSVDRIYHMVNRLRSFLSLGHLVT